MSRQCLRAFRFLVIIGLLLVVSAAIGGGSDGPPSATQRRAAVDTIAARYQLRSHMMRPIRETRRSVQISVIPVFRLGC